MRLQNAGAADWPDRDVRNFCDVSHYIRVVCKQLHISPHFNNIIYRYSAPRQWRSSGMNVDFLQTAVVTKRTENDDTCSSGACIKYIAFSKNTHRNDVTYGLASYRNSIKFFVTAILKYPLGQRQRRCGRNNKNNVLLCALVNVISSVS